jgi:hypothetical protein
MHRRRVLKLVVSAVADATLATASDELMAKHLEQGGRRQTDQWRGKQ